ncbi:uncharacterized protein Dvar_08570 [Desulfosarcina variabilis str. Montpellier]
MSLSTIVDMTKKKPTSFIGRVSGFGSPQRKHIEIPKDKRDEFESGDAVFVEKIER